MPTLHTVLLLQSNCLSSSVYNTGWYSQVYHRPITHFTLMCWFACIIIIEGGAYSVFMQEKRLFDIMTHEVSTFLGEFAKVLQIQMEK